MHDRKMTRKHAHLPRQTHRKVVEKENEKRHNDANEKQRKNEPFQTTPDDVLAALPRRRKPKERRVGTTENKRTRERIIHAQVRKPYLYTHLGGSNLGLAFGSSRARPAGRSSASSFVRISSSSSIFPCARRAGECVRARIGDVVCAYREANRSFLLRRLVELSLHRPPAANAFAFEQAERALSRLAIVEFRHLP